MNLNEFCNSNGKQFVCSQDKELPILFDVDVAIVGGSFAAVSAARELAKEGKQVVVIEERTYLGREVTATLRPWITNPVIPNVPPVIKKVLKRSVDKGDELALYLDYVKIALEDLLLSNNISLLYASFPTALFTDRNGRKSLVVGNKSGRQVINANLVIDATESSSVLRLVGEQFEVSSLSTSSFSKTIEFYRTEGITDKLLKIPEEFGIDNNTVRVHQGYLENGHVLLEFQLTFHNEKQAFDLDQKMKCEIESRHKMIQLAEYFIQHHPSFRNAYLATSSYELQGINFPSLKSSVSQSVANRFNTRIQVGKRQGQLADFVGSNSEIWCLNECARMMDASQLLSDPVTSSEIGKQLGIGIAKQWDEILHLSATTIEPIGSKNGAVDKWTLAELDEPQAGKTYDRKLILGQDIPILHHTDVLVVGGGTSGVTAAITSAKEGMDTLLLEMNPGLGGTATFGAVDSYWFGRRVGFNLQITEKVSLVHKRINHNSPKWNLEAKMYALLDEVVKAGVKTYFNTKTIGAILEGNRVRGVIVASSLGTFAVTAEIVIDATGDGDIAAFAGAEYIYGSERDHIVMWYSLAQFAKPGRSQNNFTSMVHISNIVDYTRAILDGRRRKRNRDIHDHGIYVASRETRHILGEVVMTMTDQLRHRQWEDVINIHFSNHDMKGKSGADWMNLGLIPPNLEIEIPYRMVLPKGLEGIFIAGKAISATHDGFAAIRMQSDLENLGGIVALAAAQAIRNNQLPSKVDVKELQKRVVKEGMLPEEILNRKAKNKEYQKEELEELVDLLTGNEQPLYDYADMPMEEVYKERIPLVEVCTVGPRVIPYLEKALDKAIDDNETKKQITLAQALAMYESSYGVPVLIREIQKELERSGDQLPIRDNHIAYTQLPPDHGAMPDVCYPLYSLGMAKDERSIPIWKEITEKIDPSAESLKDMFIGTFYYVDAVCYGIERLADPKCIEILEKLYNYDILSNQIRKGGVEEDYFKERKAMLELCIARALARCGSKKGYELLIAYLEDARSLLAEQAHTELILLTKKDFNKDKARWSKYVNQNHETFQPHPLTIKLDIEFDVPTHIYPN